MTVCMAKDDLEGRATSNPKKLAKLTVTWPLLNVEASLKCSVGWARECLEEVKG